MKINVDELLNRVLPWECEITLRGKTYKVRPPTLADVDVISKFKGNNGLGETEMARALAGLFDDPKPTLTGLNIREFNLIAQTVIGYIGDYLSRKKTEELLAAAGIGSPPPVENSTSGEPLPPSAPPTQASAIQ